MRPFAYPHHDPLMELISTTPIPGDSSELGLYQRGSDYFIRIVGGQDLMNSRAHGSEDALGRMACAEIAGTANGRVLVGGLGMGFTLAAALGALKEDAEVVVVEIVPGVVDWNHGPLGSVAGRPLEDPRVRVEVADVFDIAREDGAPFDAILLDVDNGPDGLTRPTNEKLYTRTGLATLSAALRPRGVLAVWSAAPDRAFSKRLRSSGFSVEERTVRAHAGKGARHVIWMARRGN